MINLIISGQHNAANVSLEVVKELPRLQERDQSRGRFGNGGRGGFGGGRGGYGGNNRFSGGRGGFSDQRNKRFSNGSSRGRGYNNR